MSERSEVQDPLIRCAADVGWTFIPRDDALTRRGGETGLFFGDVLAAQLRALNPRLTFDPQTVIRQLENVRAGIEGNHETLLYLRGQESIYDPAQKRELNLTLIDFEHPDANLYHVTDEWEYTNGRHTNRGDVMFLVNGVPVVLVETKGALTCGFLKSFVIPLPVIDEQREIAHILQAVDAKIAAAERKRAGLEELFRAMLGELMTGRMRATSLIESPK